jgi:hypothetical protein
MRGPQSGRQRRGIKAGKLAFGFVKPPDQQQAPDLKRAGMGGIRAVAMTFQRGAGRLQRLGRPTQIA